MASSSAGYFPPTSEAESSSSQSIPTSDALFDDSDNSDPITNAAKDRTVLSEDPLVDDTEEIVSFKRKQKQPATTLRFLTPFAGSRQNSPSAIPSPRNGTPRPASSRLHGNHLDGHSNTLGLDTNVNSPKDGSALDWYVEGPGRRVGYEDMTAIDWIFEYTKERQRLRVLYSSATGLLGYAQRMLDASQIWVVLILTGLAVGLVAAGIDVASDWLGDLKTGYCSAGPDGGRFYLNKYFCCWGYDEWSQCRDWVPWSLALHVTSKGGSWIVEYIFFVLYSVSMCRESYTNDTDECSDSIRGMCEHSGNNFCDLRKAQWDTRDQDGAWWLCDSAFYGYLDVGDKIARTGGSSCSNTSSMLTSSSALQLHLECGLVRRDHWCT